jgi:hypothetical protein
MVAEIPLTQGFVALVDDADADAVSQLSWYAEVRTHTVYAKSTLHGRAVYLHRFLLGLESDAHVDHRDRNGLNCQRANLRPANDSLNHGNQAKRSGSTLPYKGISFERARARFQARCKRHGVIHRSRWFRSAEEAAHAYDELARRHFGEFARVNFPREGEMQA